MLVHNLRVQKYDIFLMCAKNFYFFLLPAMKNRVGYSD